VKAQASYHEAKERLMGKLQPGGDDEVLRGL